MHRCCSQGTEPESQMLLSPVITVENVAGSPGEDEEDFETLKKKPKENGRSAFPLPAKPQVTATKSHAPAKVKTPEKRMCTSAVDFFGMGNIKRSNKKLVEAKKEEGIKVSPKKQSSAAAGISPEKGEKRISPGRTSSPPDESSVKMEKGIKEENKNSSHAPSEPLFSHKSKASSEKTSPVKTSSKLALLKQKDDLQKKEKEISSPGKSRVISPKSEQPKAKDIAPKKEQPKAAMAISPKKEMTTPVRSSQRYSETSPEDSEKKRGNYMAYRSYLNREGPKALGSKDIPQGADNCMEGLTFVITGVLESIERDEAKSLVERYGGKVTGNVSKKTNYLIMGRDAGESKREKVCSVFCINRKEFIGTTSSI
ncbi:hypothetical protein AB205_0127640 [Aquarana catesbeiana]|uniref:BRCT domain-containing protein n=1 Tax=Aquarana catesbeiana TaxID=8400 RepID=A0A2G9S3M8_AQUCT|nr:hypothetical protein AB205_0127640 [Aquarana catesbeiana]